MIFVQGKCHLGHDNEPQVQVDGQDYFGSIKTKKPLLKRKRRRGLGVSSEYMLRERDGFSCLKCGSTDDLQNDHVVPLSKGGWNCFENYQTLCGKCNTWKADRYIDFRGDLIRLFQECGFYFHAENMIRKDPKTAAIRTKNRQLMHGTTKKDSSIVRPGLADYILTFKKPGENKVPIQNNIPFDLWCKIAEPVWIDINESDTLDYRAARDNDDERHITPTQLTPIEWCYNMWCNKGETVLSPFSGVASEGYVAIKTGRKYYGIELKESYYDLSVKNLQNAELQKQQLSLF